MKIQFRKLKCNGSSESSYPFLTDKSKSIFKSLTTSGYRFFKSRENKYYTTRLYYLINSI